MKNDQFYEKLKRFYSSTFDLEEGVRFGGFNVDCYGHFNADNSRYVLTKKAKLWEANCQEHCFILRCSVLEPEAVGLFDKMLHEYAEPVLVRRGEKYPPQNHMYSFLTGVFILDEKPSDDVIKQIKKYKFRRDYLFSVRGYMEARIVMIYNNDTDKGIITNGSGKSLFKLFSGLLG